MRRVPGGNALGNTLVVAVLAVSALAWLLVQPELGAPDVDLRRWIAAVFAVAAWVASGAFAAARARRAMRPVGIDAAGTMLVVFATQTGFAEELADRTAEALTAAGHDARTCPLARLDARTLAAARFAFFIVATHGDGEAPDTSQRFVRDTLREPAALAGLRYGLLALGDRTYATFCAFGRDLERWLDASGATAAFARIDVDNGAPDALARWQVALRPWIGAAPPPSTTVDPFTPWRLVERRLANAGSLGEPMFHVRLEPLVAEALRWEAGDIAVVRLPGGEQRDYSIASLPSDGRLDLLVRRATRPDGTPGHGAQWLTATLDAGATTALRIRANHGFRLEGVAPSTPLILIGNGTGIAGLRAHAKARAASGARRNWLFFGERQAACDDPYADEIVDWPLERISHAWSRDGERRFHVQDRLRDERVAVGAWIATGAVVLVCGSADGMAGGVDAALREIAGDDAIDAMRADGRYRRDVY